MREVLNMIVVLLFLSAATKAAPFNMTFQQIETSSFPMFMKFIHENNKTYESHEEFTKRYKIFRDNLIRIKTTQENDPGAEYAINRFADLSAEEFNDIFLRNIDPDTSNLSFLTDEEYKLSFKTDLSDIPENFDWREKNVITPVKNQGMCGACWAFSATHVVESHVAIQTGVLNVLSPQQLLDCDKTEHGCGGGLHFRALDYISQAGMVSEKDYPYTGHKRNCTLNESKVVAKIKGYKNITSNESDMQRAIIEYGPLSVGLEASSFQFYWRGIADPWCGKTNNHAVLVTGYGNGRDWLFRKKDFWVIKNSWGTWWGESGYIRLVRGKGACGITKAPSIPIF